MQFPIFIYLLAFFFFFFLKFVKTIYNSNAMFIYKKIFFQKITIILKKLKETKKIILLFAKRPYFYFK